MHNFKQVKAKTSNFTIIDNQILKNKNLSLKAKGLLITLLSLPADWHFTEKGLCAATGEGLKSLKSGLKELEDNGYLVRFQVKAIDGKFGNMHYVVSEEPVAVEEITDDVVIVSEESTCENEPIRQKGITDKADVPKRHNAKTDVPKGVNAKSSTIKDIYNKESNIIKNTNNIINNRRLKIQSENVSYNPDPSYYNPNWMDE